jgi:TonB-linked SusC/RagA family outer membrane protein
MNKRYIPLLITLLFLVVFSRNTFGQEKQQPKLVTIESVVVDESGAPVSNAIISGKEGAKEVLSDSEGKFSIEIPENSMLLIEAKGYNSIVVSIPQSSQKVTLNKAPFLMDENNMINIPFGKIGKKETVGAMSVINPKEFMGYDNSQNFYDALLGRVPGLLGTTNIRGMGSAVFVVDGIPRDPTYINLEEVEQITVLKDANAGILYGVQANNGVILVTTKRGQAHKRKFNFMVEQGISKPVVLPKYLNSADYMGLYNEALVNDGLPKAYTDAQIALYADGKNPYEYPSVDYYSSEYLKKINPSTKIIGEFSGGNDITQYYANLGWLHSGSLYTLGQGKDASSNRINMRSNVNVKINDFIKSSLDAAITFDVNKGPNGNFWNDAATLQPQYFSPLLPVSLVKQNATLVNGANLETAKLIDGAYILGGTSQYLNNPYGNMVLAGYNEPIKRVASFNQAIDVDLKSITEGLKLKTYVAFDIYNIFSQTVTNLYAVYQPVWQQNAGGTDSISSLTKIGKDENKGVQTLGGIDFVRRIGGYGTLDYARTFNKHSITGTFLVYADKARRANVIIDDMHAHLGMHIGYNYNLKYFADFNAAYVNSPKLPEGNRGGFSPSIGLAWVLSEEGFLSSSNFINYLKLRVSAGIINTDRNIFNPNGSSYYLSESTITQEGPNYTWNDGSRNLAQAVIARSANPDLTFEKVKNMNLGIEGYFLNRSIYLDANIFTSKSTGMVIQKSTLPAYLGSYIPWDNYNENSYSGAELGITWSKTLGELSFDLGTNLLYATSKVVTRDEIYKNDYQNRQGGPVDAIFGLEAIGLFKDAADITSSPSQKFGEVKPGDIKYKDQNGDNIIDDNDALQIGNLQARVSYGINLNVKYKSFNLFVLGNGRAGSDNMYYGNYFWIQGNNKYSEEALNRWTPATATTATYPRLTSKTSSNNYRTSTYWLYKNNYFTLNRLQLTYDVPKSMANKLIMKDLSFYLRGDNLAMLSKDADKRQLNIGTEPQYRSFALGVRMKF